MRSLLVRPAMLLALATLVAGAAEAETPKRVRYCTHAGPVEFEIEGAAVRGVYEITPKKITGTLVGTLVDGRLDALWQDPDGRGHVIFLFDNDARTFASLIENSQRAPGSWTQGFWHGVLEGSKANDEEGRPALCAWTRDRPPLPAS
jgi:hypothetical protein